jgi:hypothetical protein
MKTFQSLAVVCAIFLATTLLVPPANAQSAAQTTTQKKRVPGSKPAVAAATPAAVAPLAPLQTAQIEQKCLRALNGACTNPISVESARLRAEIIPAVRVSYLGTPAGTIGGSYIPFERLFQDNPLVFGLPTFTLTFPCCVVRSK